MRRFAVVLSGSMLTMAPLGGEETPAATTSAETPEAATSETGHSVVIAGQTVRYTATAATNE